MTQQGAEAHEGQEGLFFLSEIKTLPELSAIELALWLGRGAWAGVSHELQVDAQRVIEEHRSRLNGSALLDRVELI